MRKNQKKKLLDCVDSLREVHKEIKEAVQKKQCAAAQNMLADCQELAIAIGESIEQSEGAGYVTVSFIEAYCEALFHVSEEIRYKQDAGKGNFSEDNINENRACKIINKQLIKMENSIKNDIAVRLEMAFFPYKASMWDSLESVYLTAKEDPNCDAYCVPVPYFDMNPGHRLGQMHYEGANYPKNIQITDWQTYNFEEREPDVIFIHNPYDACNLVTSVHPRFYSSNLKKYTEKLVYIPYYATSGGMAAAQSMLPAYLYVDYIVIQAPQFREYFDKGIPDEKFLPFGSPKFDKVIKKCQNPPNPPKEWVDKMVHKDFRKRVIFYNTSISSMLKDTETFLKKMEYVFGCFAGREDVCLLWRPHPLLESTFNSMRPKFRPVYDALKRRFIENSLGIFDTMPDIEDSIALSDAYIGDAATSVTSLFGVAGKPIFILNYGILEKPREDDWKNGISVGFNYLEQDRFTIYNNKLYVSKPYQYDYKYYCDLSQSVCTRFYGTVHEINGKWYVAPLRAQEILRVGEKGVEKRVQLKKRESGNVQFHISYKYEKYLLLIPLEYPALVSYDTVTGEIRYFTENLNVYVKEQNGKKIVGGSAICQGYLYIASPTDNLVYKLDIENGKGSVIEIPIQSRCGGNRLVEHRNELWILPYKGRVIVHWNPKTNEAREYEGFPEGFVCTNPMDCIKCEEQPFTLPAFYSEYLYLAPLWGNMFLKLNIETGVFSQWVPAFDNEETDNSRSHMAMFLKHEPDENTNVFKVYSFSKQSLYKIDLAENTYKEIEISFDKNELEAEELGFFKYSDSCPYACIENYFNTLNKFLDEEIVGNQFDCEKQYNAYCALNASNGSTCGTKVHSFIRQQL